MDISDEGYAINVLRKWYDASGISMSFSQVVDQLRTRGTFLTQFGKAVRKLELPKVQSAMTELGDDQGSRIPSTSEFFEAVSLEAGSVSVSDVGKAAAQGVSQAADVVVSTAKAGAVVYAAIAGLGVLMLLLSMRKERSSA